MYVIILFLTSISTALSAEHTVTDVVFFDVTIGGHPAGRLEIGLFGKDAPKTVKNFVTLAVEGVDGKTYRGSCLYKVIPGSMIYGGDITSNNGSGCPISIYGKTFPAENSKIRHDTRGLLTMIDLGDHTHGSRFMILGAPMYGLDGVDVVIGKVLVGDEVLKKVEEAATVNGTLTAPIVIADTGILQPNRKPFTIKWEPQQIRLYKEE